MRAASLKRAASALPKPTTWRADGIGRVRAQVTLMSSSGKGPISLTSASHRFALTPFSTAWAKASPLSSAALSVASRAATRASVSRLVSRRSFGSSESTKSGSRYAHVIHRESGRTGIIFWAASVEWVTDHIAEVEGGYHEAALSASGDTYRVERRGRWFVTGHVMRWMA